jgi:chlorite dismutase
MSDTKQPGLPTIDVNEYGGKRDGVRQQMNRRLFMQLLVLEESAGVLLEKMRSEHIPAVVYADIADPKSSGLLTWSEDPVHFATRVRSAVTGRVRDGWTMLGRTYATGYEPDLEHWLLQRPIDNVMDEKSPWHVWYPLRRSGAFARLPEQEQSSILREHAQIGLAYGQAGLAHDVRLACHGLDVKDNEFVIGLVGAELHPLSHLVQAMRKTRQTSEFIVQMGPFFVGHVAGRSSAAKG